MADNQPKAGESVLSRWSRRKLDAEQAVAEKETAEQEPAVEVALLDSGQPESDQVPPEAPVLTDADMPDLDSLTEESDFSGFMSPGVSDELRNLALRKLFRAPVFNIRDGLDEYDEDYTSFEKLGDTDGDGSDDFVYVSESAEGTSRHRVTWNGNEPKTTTLQNAS